MPYKKKATDEQVLAAYAELKNVWKVGERFGMCGQSVHERLKRLGANNPLNVFGPDDDDRLRREYLSYRDAGRLQDLADSMGRTRHFLCRQARRLGLTNGRHKKRWLSVWKYIDEAEAGQHLQDFIRSPLGLGAYSKAKGYDDLGFMRAMRRHSPDVWEHIIETKTPKTSCYRRGRQFEYRIRDRLKELGYFVMRSPASKGPIDLVAIRKGRTLFVQCKMCDALGVAEWNALFDLGVSTGAIPVLATRASPRVHAWWRLEARKDGSKKAQPRTPFDPATGE